VDAFELPGVEGGETGNHISYNGKKTEEQPLVIDLAGE
jgi:hypothetical protein